MNLNLRRASLDAILRRVPISLQLLALLLPFSALGAESSADKARLTNPRQFYNVGTKELKAGKLREAEALLECVLQSQDEPFQPSALYNLGLVRFAQGEEELKKSPDSSTTMAIGRAAVQNADQAVQIADTALAGQDLNQLVSAYLQGRGARRDLKVATEVVRRALEYRRPTLRKWERALGDFKGALELNPNDADARTNVDIVNRHIAQLLDEIRKLQELADALALMSGKLGDKMQQLKGRIPAPNMPPGAPGEDEEDPDEPNGHKPGQKEGTTREGEEMNMSPEQAGWILQGFKLDADRRLPMVQKDTAPPKDKNRPNW